MCGQHLRRDGIARVGYGHADVPTRRTGLDVGRPLAVVSGDRQRTAARHGVACVGDEVQKHPFEVDGFRLHDRIDGAQVERQPDAGAKQTLNELPGLRQHLVDVDD